jgi:hypothetical protein
MKCLMICYRSNILEEKIFVIGIKNEKGQGATLMVNFRQ